MTARCPIASTLMLALLLLRAGASPVMMECVPGHHAEGAASGVAAVVHEGHDAGTPPADPSAGCGHQSHEGQPHSSADCGLMVGCATPSLQIAGGTQLSLSAEVRSGTTLLALQDHPRPTRPASPPPKS
jgi:hypothetical protein